MSKPWYVETPYRKKPSMCASALAGSLVLAALFTGLCSAAWRPNGNIVSPFLFAETGPRVLADGRGGAFISLDQFIVGPFIQRFAASGEPATGWSESAHGVLGNTSFHGFSRPVLPISDGGGGCYLAWIQTGEFCGHGCGYNEPGRLHVQRVTAEGRPAPGWPLGGLVVSEQLAYPVNGFFATSDGDHGVWIAWQGENLYAQHVGPHAERLTDLGTIVSHGLGWHSLGASTPDRRGGVYIFWGAGDAGGFPLGHIQGQRLARDGRAHWGPDGLAVSSGTYQLRRGSLSVTTTRDGDAVVAWSGIQREDENIYATRISRGASREWRHDRVVCGALGTQLDVRVTNGSGGSVLVAWRDARPEAGVFAQRLDARGRARWRPDGVPVCPGVGDRMLLAICPDGRGGAFLAWSDRMLEWSVLATRIDRNGAPAGGWPAQASPVCHRNAAYYTQEQIVASLDVQQTGPDAAMMCWQDFHVPPTAPSAGYVEVSFVMRLGPSGVAAAPTPFNPAPSAPPTAIAGDRPSQAPRAEFAIQAVFPNPSRGQPTLRFSLLDESAATLELFDVLGRRVLTRVVTGAPGQHAVTLSAGGPLSPGTYFVRLRQRSRTAGTRLVVTR